MTNQEAMEMLNERVLFALEHYKEECQEYAEALEKGVKALEIVDKLKEYQQLEADGRLVKLPCKVGDIVFAIIKSYSFGEVGDKAEKSYRIEARNFSLEMLDGVNDNIFLTREEAEAKLEELRGE